MLFWCTSEGPRAGASRVPLDHQPPCSASAISVAWGQYLGSPRAHLFPIYHPLPYTHIYKLTETACGQHPPEWLAQCSTPRFSPRTLVGENDAQEKQWTENTDSRVLSWSPSPTVQVPCPRVLSLSVRRAEPDKGCYKLCHVEHGCKGNHRLLETETQGTRGSLINMLI